MIKVRLSIVETTNEYRAIFQIGENPYLTNKKIVYQSSREISKEIENNRVEARAISRELKEEAKKWARKHKIPYVVNIDLDPHE